MARKLPMTRKIRRLLDKGYSPKEIALRLGCTAQQVYNVRWYDNRQKGIGSLPEATPAVTLRNRGRPRKPAANTDTSAHRSAPPAPSYAPARPIPTQPSLWQRVKERMVSVWR